MQAMIIDSILNTFKLSDINEFLTFITIFDIFSLGLALISFFKYFIKSYLDVILKKQNNIIIPII